VNYYSFFLGEIRLPVTPGKISVRYGCKLSRLDLSDGREVVVGGTEALAEISFSALLPWNTLPFAVYSRGFRRGDNILADILRLQKSGEPFRFIMRRRVGGATAQNVNIAVRFSEIVVREEASDGSDIYIDVKLIEHRDVSARRVR
jgi:hypothetical protein